VALISEDIIFVVVFFSTTDNYLVNSWTF